MGARRESPSSSRFATDLHTGAEREGGLGLALVEALSGSWGYDGDEYGRDVWAEWPQ